MDGGEHGSVGASATQHREARGVVCFCVNPLSDSQASLFLVASAYACMQKLMSAWDWDDQARKASGSGASNYPSSQTSQAQAAGLVRDASTTAGATQPDPPATTGAPNSPATSEAPSDDAMPALA